MKRHDSIIDDSCERKQYSKTGIFGRIYQHSTTREQKAFTLNHHHTTTSDNSRLSKNTPRPRIRVLPEQNNTGMRSGLGQHHSLINTKLGSSAFISTTPGGSEPKTKDQEYKKLKTTTTTTHQDSSSDFFSKREELGESGIHSHRIF